MISNSQFEQIDNLFGDYNHPLSPGGALLVVKNGSIVIKKGYGYADLEKGIKAAPATNFRLASVSKQFTAAAIIHLIESNKVNYYTNLREIFTQFPEYGKAISVEKLLTHTSGLIDYEDFIPGERTGQLHDKDVFEIISRQNTTYFEPGSMYRYSNTGYVMLAMIVEKISGQRFSNYLYENIFRPLGMQNSVAHIEGADIVKDRAYGYNKINGRWKRNDQNLTSAVLGDGGIYSSVEDLFKWTIALENNAVISSASKIKSTERAVLNNGRRIDYGFGWHLKKFRSKEVVYHTGSTAGFRNIIYRLPSMNLLVIFLSNREEGNTLGLAESIIDIFIP